MFIKDLKHIDRIKFCEMVGFPIHGDAVAYYITTDYTYKNNENNRTIFCLVQQKEEVIFKIVREDDKKIIHYFKLKIHNEIENQKNEFLELVEYGFPEEIFFNGNLKKTDKIDIYIYSILSIIQAKKSSIVYWKFDEFIANKLEEIDIKI